MTDQDAVLAANLEFYRAFATRDLRGDGRPLGATGAGRLPASGVDSTEGSRGGHGKLVRDPVQPRRATHRVL